jgi:transcriptional regulator with XRE-family HTH domain
MLHPTLGTLIRVHRETLEMSRAELARQVGVAGSQVTRWEAGEFKPSLTAMVAIARALDITAVELMAAAAVDVP